MGARASAEITGRSGRWVQLTEESAALVQKHGLMVDSKSGLSIGIIRGESRGQIMALVHFARGPGATLTSPALLAGAAGLMAQAAMQQAMDEITDYLVTIDKKLDNVLRNQKDAALARMIGTGLIIDEAMALRSAGGRVNSVTWSKMQNASAVVAETQAYALLQLEGLVESLERETKISAVQAGARNVETQTPGWLAALARCSQIQDAIAIIELDRVLDIDPSDVDAHRRGLQTARRARIELMARTTDDLARRVRSVAARADSRVLVHPLRAPAVVTSNNRISGAIELFEKRLGLNRSREDLTAKRWSGAVRDVPSQFLEAGFSGAEAVARRGNRAVEAVRLIFGTEPEKMLSRKEKT